MDQASDHLPVSYNRAVTNDSQNILSISAVISTSCTVLEDLNCVSSFYTPGGVFDQPPLVSSFADTEASHFPTKACNIPACNMNCGNVTSSSSYPDHMFESAASEFTNDGASNSSLTPHRDGPYPSFTAHDEMGGGGWNKRVLAPNCFQQDVCNPTFLQEADDGNHYTKNKPDKNVYDFVSHPFRSNYEHDFSKNDVSFGTLRSDETSKSVQRKDVLTRQSILGQDDCLLQDGSYWDESRQCQGSFAYFSTCDRRSDAQSTHENVHGGLTGFSSELTETPYRAETNFLTSQNAHIHEMTSNSFMGPSNSFISDHPGNSREVTSSGNQLLHESFLGIEKTQPFQDIGLKSSETMVLSPHSSQNCSSRVTQSYEPKPTKRSKTSSDSADVKMPEVEPNKEDSANNKKTPAKFKPKTNETVESLQHQLELLEERRKKAGPACSSLTALRYRLGGAGEPSKEEDSPTSLVDVDHMICSGVTVAGFKPRAIIRKRSKTSTPNDVKNTDYWQKRRKNNDSARKSRESKKEKEKNFYKRALELEYENFYLQECLGLAEAELAALGHQFVPPVFGNQGYY